MDMSNFKPVIDFSNFKTIRKNSSTHTTNEQFFSVTETKLGLNSAFVRHHPNYKSVKLRHDGKKLLMIFSKEKVNEIDSWVIVRQGASFGFGTNATASEIRRISRTMTKHDRYRFKLEPLGEDMFLVNLDSPYKVFNRVNRGAD